MIFKKVTFSQMIVAPVRKFFLLCFGIALAFVCLEIILQISGMLLRVRQTVINKQATKAPAALRVLCLGESTTLGYPSFLEQALRQAAPGFPISVINGGVSGVTTDFIVENLEKNIVRCRPNIVVTMMGINDYRQDIRAFRPRGFSWKSFYFLRLLGLHTRKNFFSAAASGGCKKNTTVVSELEPPRYHLLRRAWQEKDLREKEALFKKILGEYPQDFEVLRGLARTYVLGKRYVEAEEILRNRLPPGIWTGGELLRLYLLQQRFADAEAVIAVAANYCPPTVIDAFSMQLYQAQGRNDEASNSLQRAIQHKISFKRATVENYRRAGEILRRWGITWVCVQYPLLSLDSLRQMIDNEDGVFFVDNEECFRAAVLRDGYWKYFTDNFAGLFGHLTWQGNRLLSEQIAAIITRQCFGVPGPAQIVREN